MWMLHVVMTQAPWMGEIGSCLPQLPMSALQGRPSVQAMLKGSQLAEAMVRAPEWIPSEALGVQGPATVA